MSWCQAAAPPGYIRVLLIEVIIDGGSHRNASLRASVSVKSKIKETNPIIHLNASTTVFFCLLERPTGQVKLSRDLSRGTGIEVCGCVSSPVQ